MGTLGGKSSMLIRDRDDLHTFAAPGEFHGLASTSCCQTSRINDFETFVLIDCPFLMQCVG